MTMCETDPAAMHVQPTPFVPAPELCRGWTVGDHGDGRSPVHAVVPIRYVRSPSRAGEALCGAFCHLDSQLRPFDPEGAEDGPVCPGCVDAWVDGHGDRA